MRCSQKCRGLLECCFLIFLWCKAKPFAPFLLRLCRSWSLQCIDDTHECQSTQEARKTNEVSTAGTTPFSCQLSRLSFQNRSRRSVHQRISAIQSMKHLLHSVDQSPDECQVISSKEWKERSSLMCNHVTKRWCSLKFHFKWRWWKLLNLAINRNNYHRMLQCIGF